ncbi:MAG: hypothetical protein OEM52_15040, partial [bacterium]|nr:hypothetical protein [bacterium]
MLRHLSFRFIGYVLLLCYALVFPPRATAATKPQTIPSPFFFTENKGQWDSRVLYKCQAKNGMTWFLERDGITLLVSREQGTGDREHGEQSVRRTFLSDDYSSRGRPSGSPNENDLPEMLRRHPQQKYPMKSHALKFHFVKGEGSKVKGEGSKVNGEKEAKEDSENLDQSFSTLHPTPYTLNPSPDFLHPSPYT